MVASHEQGETHDSTSADKRAPRSGTRRPMQAAHYDGELAREQGRWMPSSRTEPNNWLSSDRAYQGDDRNDDTLAGNIVRRVMLTDYIDVSKVHVAVSHATVTLTGTVKSESNRSEIEQLIFGCIGVQIIDNRLCIESVNRS